MGNRDIVAIGASSGGLDALRRLVREFAKDYEASILVTIHLSGQFRSSLDEILSSEGPLQASFAQDGELVDKSRIYLAPPERHLLLDGGRLRLGIGPRENHARPAIDPMFRSIAVCCGARAIGVVLTGSLSDGAAGLAALKLCGGITVVQDPRDAAFPEMPTYALGRLPPDHVARLRDMPALLGRLAAQPEGHAVTPPASMRFEVEIARTGRSDMAALDRLGQRSTLTCPDCGGTMWEVDDGDVLRYRCHVGHAYSAEAVNLGLDETLRRGMASALRALEERVALVHRLREQAQRAGQNRLAQSWAERAAEYEAEAEVVRATIRKMDEIAAARQAAE